MKHAIFILLLFAEIQSWGQNLRKADHSTIHYNQQPTLELVWVNGRQRYVETWDYVPAQYITYSTSAKTEAATGNSIGDTLIGDVVTRVHDGDSYYLKGMSEFARIAGIDAPEIYWGAGTKTQPFGREIGDSIRLILKGKTVTYVLVGFDKYKNPLISLFVNGIDFAEYVLSKGWAWHQKTNVLQSEVNRRYKAAYQKAKAAKIGCFADNDPSTEKYDPPIAPWTHRTRNPPIKKR